MLSLIDTSVFTLLPDPQSLGPSKIEGSPTQQSYTPPLWIEE